MEFDENGWRLWEPEPPRVVRRLGIDRRPYPWLLYREGRVVGRRERNAPWEVITEVGLLRDPDEELFIDDNGDLASRPEGGGRYWTPPAVQAYELAYERVPELAGGRVPFARLPLDGLRLFESEPLPPSDAIALWRELADRADDSGLRPVIACSHQSARLVERWPEFCDSNARTVEQAATVDIEAVLAARLRALEDTYGADIEVMRRQLAAWDGATGPASRTRFHVSTVEQNVVVVAVDCPAWQLPIEVGLGTWNDVPGVDEQAALMRYWNERDHAVLAVVGGAYYELLAPPADTERLRELAWEQFSIASDIVFQGTRDLDRLAAELRDGYWFLWWD